MCPGAFNLHLFFFKKIYIWCSDCPTDMATRFQNVYLRPMTKIKFLWLYKELKDDLNRTWLTPIGNQLQCNNNLHGANQKVDEYIYFFFVRVWLFGILLAEYVTVNCMLLKSLVLLCLCASKPVVSFFVSKAKKNSSKQKINKGKGFPDQLSPILGCIVHLLFLTEEARIVRRLWSCGQYGYTPKAHGTLLLSQA